MDIHFQDRHLVIRMIKKQSIYPRDVMDKLKCKIRTNKSPAVSFSDSDTIQLELGNFQTFVHLSTHKHNTLESIVKAYQKEFNTAVKGLLTEDEYLSSKYPELVI